MVANMKWDRYKSDRSLRPNEDSGPLMDASHYSPSYPEVSSRRTHKPMSIKASNSRPTSIRQDNDDDDDDEVEIDSTSTGGGGFKIPFDPLRLPGGLIKRWIWPVISGSAFLMLAFLGGCFKFGDTYTATGVLIKNKIPNTFATSEIGEPFKPSELSTPSFLTVMKSMPVLQQVSSKSAPYVSPKMLGMYLEAGEERNTDFVWVGYKGFNSPEATVNLLQLYMEELVQFIQRMQSQEALEVNAYLKQQIAQTDREMATVNQDLLAFTRTADFIDAEKQIDTYLSELSAVDLQYETAMIDYETLGVSIDVITQALRQQSPLSSQIQDAQRQIDNLLLTLTEKHPKVMEQRAYLQELLKKDQNTDLDESSSSAKTPIAQLTQSAIGADLYMEIIAKQATQAQLKARIDKLLELRSKTQQKLAALPEKGMQYARILARKQTLQEAKKLLGSRQREAQLFEDNAIGEYRIFTRPAPERVEIKSRWYKIAVVSAGGMGFGLFVGVFLALVMEILDNRILTKSDVSRATGLDVIGRLPPLKELPPDLRRQWAFRTWTRFHGQMASPGMNGLTLGFISMQPGEGRSTWIRMLAEGAHQRGLNVIWINTSWSAEGRPSAEARPDTTTSFPMIRKSLEDAIQDPAGHASLLFEPEPGGLYLAPDRPLVWTGANKRAWSEAIRIWNSLASFAVMVELPPADFPESLNLAEVLPRILWVCRSGWNKSAEMKPTLEVYHNAHCPLNGALINDEAQPVWVQWLPFS